MAPSLALSRVPLDNTRNARPKLQHPLLRRAEAVTLRTKWSEDDQG